MLKKSTQAILATTAVIMASFAIAPNNLMPAQATHGTYCDSTQGVSCDRKWSRASGDNHRVELVCSTTYPNDCRVAMYLHSSLDNIKGSLNFQQIGQEAIKAMDYLVTAYSSTATSRMGMISQAYSSTWDNKVYGYTINPDFNAEYGNILVHVPCFLCAQDKHFQRIELKVNTYQGSSFMPFELAEKCTTSGIVQEKMVQKTFRHEFFHMMGFAHSPDSNSIVSDEGYNCGVGFTRNSHDTSAYKAKYP